MEYHMLRKRSCLAAVMIAICWQTISGETNTSLSFTDVLKIAADSSISIHLSQNQTLSRIASARQANGSLLPSLSASASTSKRIPFRDDFSPPATADAGISLSYSLSAKTFYDRNSTILGKEAAEASEQQTRDDILLRAAQLFLNIVSTSSSIEVEDANLEYQKTQLEQVEAFYQSGRKSISDVLQQKTFLSEAQSRVLRAQHARDLARMELYSLLGIPFTREISFNEDEVWNLSENINSDSSFTQADPQEIFEISSIEAQKKSVLAAKESLRGAQLANLPSLGVSAGVSVDKTLSSTDREIGGPDGRVGVSLSFPIFDRFQRSTSVTRAEIDLQSEQLRLEQLSRDAALAFQRAMLDWRSARLQTGVVNDRLTSAQQSLEAVKERYAAGAATLTEVSSVNSQYLEARLSQVEAQLQVVDSYLNILHKSGRITTIIGSENEPEKGTVR